MTFRILGCGNYLPKKVITNADLEQSIDTTEEWIRTRTGILQRHIADQEEYASHLALKAANAALLDARISSTDLDLIIVCTTTPDNSFPATATKLQGYFNLDTPIPSFDLQAVCSGFIYGLHVADGLFRTGKYNTILLISAEKMSSLLNWQDRNTCILFGDGASAVILQRDQSNLGLIDSKIYSDGKYYDILYTDGGVSMNGYSGKINMKGKEVFKHAVEKMSASIEEILVKNAITVDEVTYLIPHQANLRIIEAIAERLNFNPEKVIKAVAMHANCSAASIPLALTELKNSGKLKKDDILLFTALGAGITWGSAIIQW